MVHVDVSDLDNTNILPLSQRFAAIKLSLPWFAPRAPGVADKVGYPGNREALCLKVRDDQDLDDLGQVIGSNARFCRWESNS